MNSQRLGYLARAACVGLVLLSVEAAISQSNPPPAPPTQSTVPGTAAPSDAAEKHIKRTACLKQAKAKKLVGDQKNAFIKNCVDAPPSS
jgi:psiF repeat